MLPAFCFPGPILSRNSFTKQPATVQVIWSASILVAVPVLLQSKRLQIPTSHTEVLSGAAAVGSIFAELFMIQSLLVFDPEVKQARESKEQPGSPQYNRKAVSLDTALLSSTVTATVCNIRPETLCSHSPAAIKTHGSDCFRRHGGSLGVYGWSACLGHRIPGEHRNQVWCQPNLLQQTISSP